MGRVPVVSHSLDPDDVSLPHISDQSVILLNQSSELETQNAKVLNVHIYITSLWQCGSTGGLQATFSPLDCSIRPVTVTVQ